MASLWRLNACSERMLLLVSATSTVGGLGSGSLPPAEGVVEQNCFCCCSYCYSTSSSYSHCILHLKGYSSLWNGRKTPQEYPDVSHSAQNNLAVQTTPMERPLQCAYPSAELTFALMKHNISFLATSQKRMQAKHPPNGIDCACQLKNCAWHEECDLCFSDLCFMTVQKHFVRGFHQTWNFQLPKCCASHPLPLSLHHYHYHHCYTTTTTTTTTSTPISIIFSILIPMTIPIATAIALAVASVTTTTFALAFDLENYPQQHHSWLQISEWTTVLHLPCS